MADGGSAARKELKRIKLGHSDVEITRIGFGCMGMSEFYGPANDENSIRVLQAALDSGINFFDTADMYGAGDNEELLGRAFAGRWDELVLSTKFGAVRGPNREFLGVSNKPEYIRNACDASLRRLGREHIDLYFMHRRDREVPLAESLGTMYELQVAGKIRFIGISEVSVAELQEASSIVPIDAVQNELSMWSREPLQGMLEATQELETTFIAYSPLGRGFLTGAIPDREALTNNDWRLKHPRFSDEAMEHNRKFVEVVKHIARFRGFSNAQVALAWVLAQGENIAIIPGTRRLERLAENIAAEELVFSEAELAEINHQLPQETAGTRY